MKGVGIIKNLRQAFVRENEVIKFENSLSGPIAPVFIVKISL